MSEPSPVDYEAVLADLRDKRDKIDAAIAGIETMLGIRAVAVETPPNIGNHDPYGPLGPGAFLGMTIADAAKKYLAHKRQNQRTEEILNALKAGGLIITAQEPLNTVGSTLLRNFQSGGDIVRVSRGVWGLAEWHPRLKAKRNNGATSAEEALSEARTPTAAETLAAGVAKSAGDVDLS